MLFCNKCVSAQIGFLLQTLDREPMESLELPKQIETIESKASNLKHEITIKIRCNLNESMEALQINASMVKTV